MASVEQVRGQIDLAKDQAQRAVQALQEAGSQLEQAAQGFQEAAQGSNQSEASDVSNMFQKALQAVGEARDATMAAMSNAESFAGRL